MIKEFLDAIFAPNKLMLAIEKLREENAGLRHELRRYTLHTYTLRIEPMFKRKEGYMQHLHRRALQAIAAKIADDPRPYSTVVPLSHPEMASAPYPDPDRERFPHERLVVQLAIRRVEPLLPDVPAPCEEDPDWVIEEYAYKIRQQDTKHLRRPFIRISLLKRMNLMDFNPSMDEVSVISRVATVRFEKDGTPFVVAR
jgi:hypothetical protein